MEEGLYYPCSENKGADQLRGYREADLRLCFRICKKPVFSRRGSYEPMRDRSNNLASSVDSDQPLQLRSLLPVAWTMPLKFQALTWRV